MNQYVYGKPFQLRQGLDCRLLTKAKAQKLANANYHGDYIFAFDNIDDSELISRKLKLWRRHCDKRTMVYVLCGFIHLKTSIRIKPIHMVFG